MVNFNHPAQSGVPFEGFGSWVKIDYEDFLEDIQGQPEVFHITSHVPFMGIQKNKTTKTGRVSKNEKEWMPVRECVVLTTPFGPNHQEVFILAPNIRHWKESARHIRQDKKYWQRHYINSFVKMGKIDFKNTSIANMNRVHHIWNIENYYATKYSAGQNTLRKGMNGAREGFLEAIFEDANDCNEAMRLDQNKTAPFYLQYVGNKKTFLESLAAAKRNFDFMEGEGHWWHATDFLDIKVLTEIRGLSSAGLNIKLLNWPISSNLLDYLEIAPNPLRPFLWELELETDENGNLVPYGQTKDTVSNPSSWGLDTKQQWGNYRKSQLTKRDKVRGTGIFGLLPHNEWRSWSPEAKWRTYELGLESAWDDYGMESETFEAAGRGSKYPPQYLDLSETGVCFVVTPHFQEQWNDEKRYGPQENQYLPSIVDSWRDGKAWFWEQLVNPPLAGNFHYTKIRKGGVAVAYIYWVKRFNHSRGRQEIELITVTPPSHATGFGGSTIQGIPHTETTEYPTRSLPFNAESFNSRVMAAHNNPKGFCPICGGPIPNAEHRGKYPGALSRYDNETEICSLCGSAEALAPMMDEDAKFMMMTGHSARDWNSWATGVLIGRDAVKEMQEASARAAKTFKEGKFQIGDVTVEVEDITDEYMERDGDE